MGAVQPLTVSHIEFSPFKIPLLASIDLAGHLVRERSGYYLTLKTTEGFSSQGEIAPLEGLSPETPRRVRRDLQEACSYLKAFPISRTKEGLLEQLKHEPNLNNTCASVRFGVESALLQLAAQANSQVPAEFLGANLKDVSSAILLQGPYQQVMADFKHYADQGARVFKLKVGEKNIALDVKKVNEIRERLDSEAYLRLDANRKWNLKEACIFAELIGPPKIDFIEEPLQDPAKLTEFCRSTGMRTALDESLSWPDLPQQEGVVAFIIKPMLLGLIKSMDWIEKARSLQRKAIISSVYESPVGFKMLAHLACLSGQIAGLGTRRYFKSVEPMMQDNGLILKASLT